MSHDVEDVIAVVAGRDQVITEIAASSGDLRAYLARCTSDFLAHEDADAAIEDALPDARSSPAIATRARSRLLGITRLDSFASE